MSSLFLSGTFGLGQCCLLRIALKYRENGDQSSPEFGCNTMFVLLHKKLYSLCVITSIMGGICQVLNKGSTKVTIDHCQHRRVEE